MPVLITAHPSDVEIVRAVAARLREAGGEVRCYLEEDDYELRSIGCKIAVGRLADYTNLDAALTNVHTFMPLLPDGVTIERHLEEYRQFAGSILAAGKEAHVEQTIVALPGLRPPGNDVSTLVEGLESALDAALKNLCLIRVGVITTRRHGGPGTASGVPAATIEELVEVLTAADDHEGLSGTFELARFEAELAGLPDGSSYLQAVASARLRLSNSATELLEDSTS